MPPDSNQADDEQFLAYGHELAAALAESVPEWIERCVITRVAEDGRSVDDTVRSSAREAAEAARRDIVPRLTELLARDVDDQTTNPLSILRDAVVHPTDALRALGVSPRPRDRFAVERFPDDDYDLSPASFADIDPALAELGIRWGAAKAFVHRARHRS